MSLNTDDAAGHWIPESFQAVRHLPKMAPAGASVAFSGSSWNMCICPRKDNTELSRLATAVRNTPHAPDQLYNEEQEKPSKLS